MVGGNPGRLTFKWSVALADGESALDDQMKQAMVSLVAQLKKVPETSTDINLKSSETPFIGKKITFTVRVENFLNNFKEGYITVQRVNKELPQAQLDRQEITAFVANEIRVKGMAHISHWTLIAAFKRKSSI